MAKYRLLEKAFINERLWEAGEEITLPDDVIPGPHMLPMDSAARKAIKEAGVVNGPIPDPVDELTRDPTNFAETYGASPQGVKAGMNASA
ncbi:MAG: hypothetical protein ACLQBD_26730 [Syntrophobacteraceae bacterium]